MFPSRYIRRAQGLPNFTPLLLSAVLLSVSFGAPVQAKPVSKETTENYFSADSKKVSEWQPYDVIQDVTDGKILSGANIAMIALSGVMIVIAVTSLVGNNKGDAHDEGHNISEEEE